jgi:multicomponent Na+:H+ antiporter subunit B
MTPRPEIEEQEPRHRHATGWMLTAGVAVTLVGAVASLPHGARPLPAIARQALAVALPGWHTTEPVNEVVYGTRGFDTFGETFLLLAAVVGVSLVCRGREPRRGFIGEELAGRREQRGVDHRDAPADEVEQRARRAEAAEGGDRREARPAVPDEEPLGEQGPERADGMTVVIRTGVRFVAPVLTVAGLYLVAWGYSPGGGFPGGAVMLGVALLAYVSLGYARVEPVVRPGVMEPLELGGALAIVVIGVFGLVLTGSFMANFLPLGPPQTIRAGGILQAFSVSEFVEVATGLIIVVFGVLGMGHEWVAGDGGSDDALAEGHR